MRQSIILRTLKNPILISIYKSVIRQRHTTPLFHALLLFFFLSINFSSHANEYDNISAFSDPSRIWGSGIERVIEEAYRQFFQTRILGGRVMNIRMPFAQNSERDVFTEGNWGFVGSGKGAPGFLWNHINRLLDSDDFLDYMDLFTDGREKVIVFDLPTQTWTHTRDPFIIARMKAGSYQGLLHRPYVLVSGRGLEESDVYNYLYCVGLIGIDCSGFVWHILSYVAAAGGLDLGRHLAGALGVRGNTDPALYAGTGFFNSSGSHMIPVRDEIRNLRPADIILFRAEDGGMGHAAIIQSVDLVNGVIRYLQSTDEAPFPERGVHDSFIFFDPENTSVSLSHPSLIWSQRRYRPFPGEITSPFSNDGERYRAFPELGGGRVVRLRAIAEIAGRF